MKNKLFIILILLTILSPLMYSVVPELVVLYPKAGVTNDENRFILVNWQAVNPGGANTTIRSDVYYDFDDNSQNGRTLIAENIVNPSDGNNSYYWDLFTLPNKDYYVWVDAFLDFDVNTMMSDGNFEKVPIPFQQSTNSATVSVKDPKDVSVTVTYPNGSEDISGTIDINFNYTSDYLGPALADINVITNSTAITKRFDFFEDFFEGEFNNTGIYNGAISLVSGTTDGNYISPIIDFQDINSFPFSAIYWNTFKVEPPLQDVNIYVRTSANRVTWGNYVLMDDANGTLFANDANSYFQFAILLHTEHSSIAPKINFVEIRSFTENHEFNLRNNLDLEDASICTDSDSNRETSNSCSIQWDTNYLVTNAKIEVRVNDTYSSALDVSDDWFDINNVLEAQFIHDWNVLSNSARIRYTTNKTAYGKIEYGLSPSFDSNTLLTSDLNFVHEIKLSPLNSDANYVFRVWSCTDVNGTICVFSDTKYFSTLEAPPSVTVDYPNGGINTSGRYVDVNWTASDPDENALLIDIYYDSDANKDNGGSILIAEDISNTGYYIWDLIGVSNGSFFIRVDAKEEGYTARDYSDSSNTKVPLDLIQTTNAVDVTVNLSSNPDMNITYPYGAMSFGNQMDINFEVTGQEQEVLMIDLNWVGTNIYIDRNDATGVNLGQGQLTNLFINNDTLLMSAGQTTANYISNTVYTQDLNKYIGIFMNVRIPTNSDVNLHYRTSADGSSWPSWSAASQDFNALVIPDTDTNDYLQYKIEFTRGGAAESPVIYGVLIAFESNQYELEIFKEKDMWDNQMCFDSDNNVATLNQCYYLWNTTGINGNGHIDGKTSDVDNFVLDSSEGAHSISNYPLIHHAFISDVTSNKITVNWATNKLSSSLIEYGTSDANLDTNTAFFVDLNYLHEVSMTGLDPDTTYYFRVWSCDDNNANCSVSEIMHRMTESSITTVNLNYPNGGNLTGKYVDVNWIATNTNDDPLLINIYYNTDGNYDSGKGTLVSSSVSNDANYTWDLVGDEVGPFYLLIEAVNQRNNNIVYDFSDSTITRTRFDLAQITNNIDVTVSSGNSPTIEYLAPEGGLKRGGVNIDFNISDPDNDDLFASLYYSTIQGDKNNQIVTDLPMDNLVCANPDNNTATEDSCRYAWNITGIPNGTYFITIELTDTIFTVEDSEISAFTIDQSYPVSVIYPNGGEVFYTGNIDINWSAADWDGNELVDIYVDTDTDPNNGRRRLATGEENDGHYVWNTFGMSEGFYWIAIDANTFGYDETNDFKVFNGSDYSDGNFELKAKDWVFTANTVDVTVNLNTPPDLNIVNPIDNNKLQNPTDINFNVSDRQGDELHADIYFEGGIYRRELLVENNLGQSVTNYPVKFILDTETLINEGKITHPNKLTVMNSDYTEVDSYIASGWDTNETEIWVNVTLDAGNKQTLYIYYGEDSFFTNGRVEPIWANFLQQGNLIVGQTALATSPDPTFPTANSNDGDDVSTFKSTNTSQGDSGFGPAVEWVKYSLDAKYTPYKVDFTLTGDGIKHTLTKFALNDSLPDYNILWDTNFTSGQTNASLSFKPITMKYAVVDIRDYFNEVAFNEIKLYEPRLMNATVYSEQDYNKMYIETDYDLSQLSNCPLFDGNTENEFLCSRSWNTTQIEGIIDICVDLTDFEKVTTQCVSGFVDRLSPVVDMNIENDAIFTASSTPTIYIHATDATSEAWKMRFSCDNNNYTQKVPYANTYSAFDITNATYGCVSGLGQKYVYVKVTDLYENESEAVVDDINLVNAPTVVVVDPNGDEVIKAGSTYAIKYTVQSPNTSDDLNVMIYYSLNQLDFNNLIATIDLNTDFCEDYNFLDTTDCNFTWSVPNEEGRFYIDANLVDPAFYATDSSDLNFLITSGCGSIPDVLCNDENACTLLSTDYQCDVNIATVTDFSYAIYEKDVNSISPDVNTFVNAYDGNICQEVTFLFQYNKLGEMDQNDSYSEPICTSDCYNTCYDACIKNTIIKCTENCAESRGTGICSDVNGLCEDSRVFCNAWETFCETNGMVDTCNATCFGECNINRSGADTNYVKKCGYKFNDLPVQIRNQTGTCTGIIQEAYTLSKIGSEGIIMVTPNVAGNYEICVDGNVTSTVTVVNC